jgi:tryptophan synthase alpha chain
MNRIDALFERKKGDVLSVYMTAGYPSLNDTVSIIEALQDSGVDMIEIGMPFSDPLADGPVIQQSSQRALENGMSLKILFEQLQNIRQKVTIPLVLMGYLNPVMQYGMERFISDCKKTGIDGLIIPDLPLAEYQSEYQFLFEKNCIPMIMLITPQTSEERIGEIANASGGFLYVVADSSTTGARDGIRDTQMDYFKMVKDLDLQIPRLIGFGISNAETFQKACKYASGAIIGSAFIRCLTESGEISLESSVSQFAASIR